LSWVLPAAISHVVSGRSPGLWVVSMNRVDRLPTSMMQWR